MFVGKLVGNIDSSLVDPQDHVILVYRVLQVGQQGLVVHPHLDDRSREVLVRLEKGERNDRMHLIDNASKIYQTKLQYLPRKMVSLSSLTTTWLQRRCKPEQL